MGNENNASQTCLSKNVSKTCLSNNACKTCLSNNPSKRSSSFSKQPPSNTSNGTVAKIHRSFSLSAKDSAWPVLCRIEPLNLGLGAAGPKRKVHRSVPTQPRALRPAPQPQLEDLSQQKGERPEGLKTKDSQPGHRKIIFTLAGRQCSHEGKRTTAQGRTNSQKTKDKAKGPNQFAAKAPYTDEVSPEWAGSCGSRVVSKWGYRS